MAMPLDEKLANGLHEDTQKILRAIDAWAARMEPLFAMIADTHARILGLVAEQERLRQPPDKPADRAICASLPAGLTQT